ncbi:pq-loop repeat-containing protein 1-like protein [Dermatophagoides farinae]|uniref:Pq-loop repeat-containing protein 1-like protein n=2 Tax=Dermatophagoides farinae TaxID=6954 RepID=A0A9D4P1L4_DERFA|nr:pq-loop repeat-containing protein 1-like protein [Dermatophagoides farinae]
MSTNLIINTTAASIDQMNEDGTLEWIMSKIDQFPIKLSFIFACAMVLGSVVPYIPQYFTIKQTQNTEGFSLYVCLTLLIANILRIMFWFGKHFETALLIQSIVMILAMFFLLELCVRVRNSNLIIQQKRRYFSDFDLRYFWEWTDFMSYLECMAVFTLGAGLLFYFFIGVPLIVEGYGLVALVTESLLASPQFFRNLKVKSVEGMSKLMVFTWFLGDLYKTIYFFVRQAPFQFLLCGCTQITFDSLIFLQILCYKKASYRKIPKSRLKHLENRARKRFKENIRSKQMLNLLTTMSNADSNCPNPIVSTSVHHPQPLSKLNTSESLEPISPKDSNSLNDNVMDPLDLIELNGYENKGATFDSRDVKYADDDDDDDFENINIEDGNEELTAITQNNHE